MFIPSRAKVGHINYHLAKSRSKQLNSENDFFGQIYQYVFFQPTAWAICQIVDVSYQEVCPRLVSMDCPSLENCPTQISYYQPACPKYECFDTSTDLTPTTTTDLTPTTTTDLTPNPTILTSMAEDLIPQQIECRDVLCVRSLKFEPHYCIFKNY